MVRRRPSKEWEATGTTSATDIDGSNKTPVPEINTKVEFKQNSKLPFPLHRLLGLHIRLTAVLLVVFVNIVLLQHIYFVP